jgi:hypothetical protein
MLHRNEPVEGVFVKLKAWTRPQRAGLISTGLLCMTREAEKRRRDLNTDMRYLF